MREQLYKKYSEEEINNACHAVYDCIIEYSVNEVESPSEFMNMFFDKLKAHPYKNAYEIFIDVENARCC